MKKFIYSIFTLSSLLILLSFCKKDSTSKKDGIIWMPKQIEWTIFPDEDTVLVASTKLLYIDDDSIYYMDIDINKLLYCDSITYSPEPGFYCKKGKIYKIDNDTLFLKLQIFDNRMVRLPDIDMMESNKIYEDYIILRDTFLMYNGDEYTKEYFLYNESKSRILTFLLNL